MNEEKKDSSKEYWNKFRIDQLIEEALYDISATEFEFDEHAKKRSEHHVMYLYNLRDFSICTFPKIKNKLEIVIQKAQAELIKKIEEKMEQETEYDEVDNEYYDYFVISKDDWEQIKKDCDKK